MKHATHLGLILLLVLSLLLGMVTTAQAAGNEIFVSATGDDTTGDGTEGNPFATIKKAYDASASGDTIVLLSDIAQSELVSIWHDLTIKSKDGEGPYTVTRQAGFATTSDTARSWYNPAMFEAHPDVAGTTVTFANITLDDNFLYEGTSYTDQPTTPADTSANLTRVQDGIVSLYNDPANTYKCTVILENGTTLQNFGGMNGVNIEGNSELIMKAGSLITNGVNKGVTVSGVLALSGGRLTMEAGSKITGIKGSNAVFANVGIAVINGEISDCEGSTPLRASSGTIEIGADGNVHDIKPSTAAMYSMGPSTFRIDGAFHDITGNGRGIWPSGNGGNGTVYITENADIYNVTDTAVRTDIASRVFMSGGQIHNNGTALYVRKGAWFTMTGGTIRDNTYGVHLTNDSTSTARALIESGTVSGNTNDYYISSTTLGYLNGSYMYFSGDQLATAPDVGMQTNAKHILPSADNSELYLGNASQNANTALTNQVNAITTGGTVLATWFAQVPESALHVTVADLAAQTDPIYAISYPVDAAGAITDSADPVIYAMTQAADARNSIDVVAAAATTNGRAYALFTSPDPMWIVSFDTAGGPAVPSEAVPDGGNAHQPANPHWRLHRFEGWFTDDTYTTPFDFSAPITADTVVYAQWSAVAPQTVDLSKVEITKNVDKAASASYDPITFTFELEPYAVKPLNGTLAVSDMPDLGTLSVSMSGTQTTATVAFPTDKDFPLGGVYTYKVTERNDGVINWTYDDTVYYVDLEIEENASGDLELDKVVIHKDGADGTKDTLLFTNVYNPPTDLTVTKVISNFGENPLNKTKEFTYTITFTEPAAGSIGDITATYTSYDSETGTYGTPVTLTSPEYGVPYTFTLKHNEKVVFGNLAADTTYVVTEQGEEYYTPSVTIKEGDNNLGTTTGTYAEDLTGSGTAVQADPDKNHADFSNEYSITPPTGVTIHSELLIILAVAVAALAGSFVLSRKLRKAKK